MFRRSNNPSGRSRKLSFQSLEPRTMMAGDVEAHVSSIGDLRITGDNNSNDIQITQTVQNGVPVPGSYTVTGVSNLNTTNNSPTTINGHTSQTFTGVTHDINVATGGGLDRVSLTVTGSTPTTGFTVPHDLIVSTGTGPATTSPIGNFVYVNGFTIGNNVSINTQTSNDTVDVTNSVITNDLSIFTGGGADIAWIANSSIGHDVTINTGTNTVRDVAISVLNTNVGRNLSITTGQGSNKVDLSNVGVHNDLNLLTGKGDDTVNMDHVTVMDALFADLGYGDDTINFRATRGGYLTLDGGDGLKDSLNASKDGMEFRVVRSISGFEFNHELADLF
jgi:hypothetical protein